MDLHDIDIDSYVMTSRPTAGGQFLRVSHDGRDYSFTVLHSGVEWYHAGEKPVPYGMHAHALYHIVLYTHGQGRFPLRGKIHPCGPGTLVVSSPGEPHAFPPLDSVDLSYTEVTFEFAAGEARLHIPFHELLAAYIGAPVQEVRFPLTLEEGEWRRLEALIRALRAELRQAHPAALFFAGVVMARILAHLARILFGSSPAGGGDEETRLLRAREELESRFREQVTLKELAGLAGLSVGYFSREFKRRFGVTPIGYQRQLRVNAAKLLLSATSLKCREIALRTGFADVYYFSRVFKRLVGVSPLACRRRK